MRDVPGVILAGGRATRLGGRDKALERVAGRCMLAHVIERLAPQVSGLAVSANGDPARFATFGLPVLADSAAGHHVAEFQGPLAGILAALDWAAGQGAEAVVTAACDTPFLPRDLVARLVGAVASGPAVAASRDSGGELRRHPTCGLWPVALRKNLRVALLGGTRKAGAWAARHGAGVAVFDSRFLDPFFNVNTPEDLLAAEAMLAG